MLEPESCALAAGTAMVYSAKCPGKETSNEDAAAVIAYGEDSGILAVADGVGGFRAGEEAARTALEVLERSLQDAARDGLMLRTAVLNGLEEANRAVQALGAGAATTIVVVEIREGFQVRPYHIGDSMILVTGQRGKVKLQTVSHSPVGYAVHAGMLDPAEAMHHEDRHIVSNVIGVPEMWIEMGPTLKLAPRDTLLLASDGLFDNLHVEEIVECIRKGPVSEAAGRLAALTRQRMTQPIPDHPCKPDDVTFVLFRRR